MFPLSVTFLWERLAADSVFSATAMADLMLTYTEMSATSCSEVKISVVDEESLVTRKFTTVPSGNELELNSTRQVLT